MWYTLNVDTSYTFELQRGVLASSPTIENLVGPFLRSSLANFDHLKAITTTSRTSLRRRITLLLTLAQRENIRIGDFGEVVAGYLLEDEENVVRAH